MSKIKVSELFYSCQGEGRYMGVPSVFLRTFGCNFSCRGFGMPKGQLSTEADQIDASNYADYKDLPLVSTGCDSYASWHSNFKHLSPVLSVEQIAEQIINLLPHHQWREEHLVITGGEPLLGWQRSYPELFAHPLMRDCKEITFETNGTQELSAELVSALNRWDWDEVTFSVSPKLSLSGEDQTVSINPAVIRSYQDTGFTYLKFVVATEDDVAEALQAIELYQYEGFRGPIYLMPVGGTESVYTLNNRRVAELALRHGLRYSDRLQIPLFRNAWGT